VIGFDLATVVLAIASSGLIWWLVASVVTQRRRAAVRTQSFEASWREILRRRMPLYEVMPGNVRARVERLALDFLSRVDLIGCAGLRVTPEMQIVIAGHAALLALKHGPPLYANLRSVLLYPSEFVAPIHEEDATGIVTEGSDILSGQAIETEQIVLSWQDLIEPPPGPGAWNLALHEFAHYIDETFSGALSARPGSGAGSSTWHDVFEAEFARLQSAGESPANPVIDPYGSEDPAEFFATATEAFFEMPTELRDRHTELYRLLEDFYGVDPASWRLTGQSITA
jgi:MtfA peptidase